MSQPSETRAVDLRRRLLAWYRRHRRALPWREPENAGDAYRVWVSEIMLQQTQVTVVIPYYERFLGLFPTLPALAEASEEAVLAAWSGLGYYRRARQLHATARAVVAHYGGELPRDTRALMALPGVGAYTAGAIASIAWDEPVAAVDGNVARIASRLAGGHLSLVEARREAETWLPRHGAGAFNQALMDLGALVCLPRNPACGKCPLHAGCATRAALPARAAAPPRLPVERHYVWALRHGRIFLRQRPPTAAQLAGMWELPQLEAAPAKPPLLTLKHAITNSDITASVYAIKPAGCGVWMSTAKLDTLPLTGLSRKIIRRMLG